MLLQHHFIDPLHHFLLPLVNTPIQVGAYSCLQLSANLFYLAFHLFNIDLHFA